jgi:hypothetical protein
MYPQIYPQPVEGCRNNSGLLAEVLAQIPQRLGSSRQPNSGSGQLTMPENEIGRVRACRVVSGTIFAARHWIFVLYIA